MLSRRPFVVYWNNIPAPYMVDRFNALAARGNLDFQAWFNERTLWRKWGVAEESWRFAYRYLPTLRVLGKTLHLPAPLLGRRPDVLVSLYAEPCFVAGWLMARARRIRTCFRVLKTHDAWVRRHPLKEALKHALFRNVHGVETPGGEGRAFAMRYGVPAEKVFIATHTVDLGHFRAGAAAGRASRDALRASLGLRGCAFIYVGRLWMNKGLGYLVDAFARVQAATGPDGASLLLLGDGPDEAALREAVRTRGLRNVVFAGFRQKPELPGLFAASDVFVFPTLGDPYGLVVDEAMACGLPVVSTSAASEIRDRIEDGWNGFVVPPADADALAAAMLRLATDPMLRAAGGERSADRVASHTPERWAEAFEGMVSAVLEAP